MATDGMTKAEAWKTAFETVKQTTAENLTNYKTLVDKLVPSRK
jgi:hypothetical protein